MLRAFSLNFLIILDSVVAGELMSNARPAFDGLPLTVKTVDRR